MFNSREYEWNDISVVMAGRLVTGLRGIKFGSKQEKEHLFAKGNKPHSIQRGNISYSGEITITQSEYETLLASAKGDVLNAQFDVVVSYGNPSKGEASATRILVGCEITDDEEEWKQGDKFLEKRLPFLFVDLKVA